MCINCTRYISLFFNSSSNSFGTGTSANYERCAFRHVSHESCHWKDKRRLINKIHLGSVSSNDLISRDSSGSWLGFMYYYKDWFTRKAMSKKPHLQKILSGWANYLTRYADPNQTSNFLKGQDFDSLSSTMCILCYESLHLFWSSYLKRKNNTSFHKSTCLPSVANFSAQLKGLLMHCDMLSSHFSGNGLVITLVKFFRM